MSQRIGHIPGLDPDSMETVLPDNAHPLEWCMNDKGEILQGPLEMTYLGGKKIVLNLAPDQVGLLTAAGKLRTIYLDGGHILDVGTRPGQIHPDWQMVFLAADRPLNLRWTFGNPIALPGPEKRHIIGICDLAITGPADFFDHFLQSLPDLDARVLLDAVERVTRQALIDYLDLACCQGMGGQACLSACCCAVARRL